MIRVIAIALAALAVLRVPWLVLDLVSFAFRGLAFVLSDPQQLLVIAFAVTCAAVLLLTWGIFSVVFETSWGGVSFGRPRA
jgi:hypothetical protein